MAFDIPDYSYGIADSVLESIDLLLRVGTDSENNYAKKKLEETQQNYLKMCDDFLAKKQQEIEDAYKHYLDEQAAKKAESDEKAAARGETAGQQMRLDTDE